MGTLSTTLAAAPNPHLRPFDARHDLAPVADLVELCFADTLDPDGREYLRRMRAAAAGSSWLGWAAQAEWSQPAMGGFIWLEDGVLVGNVSLIPYFVGGRRFFLIANVAVHPSFRRQGIARQMTIEAIRYARARGAPSVWLHVREDNDPAVRLYQDLGFVERARRTSWISDVVDSGPVLEPGERIIPPPPRAWEQMRSWFSSSYPRELAWHSPLRINLLNPGMIGALTRLLYNVDVRQWALFDAANRLICSLAWTPFGRQSSAIWLAAPVDCPEAKIHTLLAASRREIATPRPLALDYPAHKHSQAIQAAGFSLAQTLIWMELRFKN